MEKAIITVIGSVSAEGQVTGWSFDCAGKDVAGITIRDNGEHLYAGYTIEELREIAEKA